MEAIQFSKQDIEDDIDYLLKGLPKPNRKKESKIKKWLKNFFCKKVSF